MPKNVEITKSSVELELCIGSKLKSVLTWTVKLRCKPGEEESLLKQVDKLDKILRAKFGGGAV